MHPFLAVFLLIPYCYGKGHVPVLIWSSSTQSTLEENTPALSKLHASQFSQIAHKIAANAKNPHIMVFIEENLSVEDFSWRDFSDSSSFPHLRNMTMNSPNFLYLPSVESPLTGFTSLKNKGYQMMKYREPLPHLTGPTIIEFHLREPSQWETRPMFLRSHDEEIYKISNEFTTKYKDGLIAYTGKHASFVDDSSVRHRRQTEDDDKADGEELVMCDREKTMYLVTKAPIEFNRGGNISYIRRVTFSAKDVTENTLTLDVNFKVDGKIMSVDFVFNATENQAWFLNHIQVEDTKINMTSKTTIDAPAGYSYFCGRDIVFKGKSADDEQYVFVFHSLQAQPRVKNNQFGPASDCIFYFTPQIWSGLLVSFLLIFVGFVSIIFIMDIHSMDRFDDTKGRTISVLSAE